MMTSLLPTDPSTKRCTFVSLLLTFVLLISSVLFGVLWVRKSSSARHSNEHAVENGIIGYPTLLPDDGPYLQWTILHMNDVYEMLPLDEGQKGGLARVAHIRDLLQRENPLIYTMLSGDFLSPSALSQAVVNGTRLNGRQMIKALNTLSVDYVTFGNHEFDLTESELINRMNESTFKWISSNVFDSITNQTFASSIPYALLTIRQARVLLIGLTIDETMPYVRIVSQSTLVPFVQQFLQSISHVKYDVLIALTHLDLSTDVALAENIPQIDLILGGHDHVNYFVSRGREYTPIYKADANAFTVYIHRCAFNLRSKQFRVASTLAKITPDVAEEASTRAVVNYWYDMAIKAFEEMGFEPGKTVSCLPEGVELDGRSSSIRNILTSLSIYGCECLLQSTKEDATTVALYNSGTIRIDDVLRGRITQYDILRILPFQSALVTVSVPGQILAKVLTRGMSLRGNGMFIAYSGVETPDDGRTWFINGTDISTTGGNYKVATIDYAMKNTDLNDPAVILIREYNITQTKSLMIYLSEIYPPC